MTLHELLNEAALQHQQRLMKFQAGEMTMAEVLEGFRQIGRSIAEHTAKVAEIPATTAQDRKDSQAWCDTIELQRDNQRARLDRFISGV